MATSRPFRRRYRILLWLDDAANPEQVDVATYLDDEVRTHTTWTPEPFDRPHDVLDAALNFVDIQLRLF